MEETASAGSMAVQAMAPAAEEMTDGAEYGLEYEQANDGGGMASGAEMESGTGDLSRKLIRDVTLEVETREFDSLLAQISERVSELGGYIESSQVSGVSLNARGGVRDRDASLKARIPADKLDSFLESVETEANVVSRQENVTDITLTYSDVLRLGLGVMDSTATAMCKDNNIPILVFSLEDPDNIVRAVMGETIGTLVKED